MHDLCFEMPFFVFGCTHYCAFCLIPLCFHLNPLERRVLFTRRLQLRSQPDGQILGIHPHQLGLAGHCELFLFFYLSTVQCYVKKMSKQVTPTEVIGCRRRVFAPCVRQLQSHCVYYVYLPFLCSITIAVLHRCCIFSTMTLASMWLLGMGFLTSYAF